MRRLLIAAALLVAPCAAVAQSPAPVEAAAPAATVLRNTPVVVALAEPVGSNTSKPGDRFAITLAEPLMVDGQVVNYIFVTVRIDLTPSANAAKLREREPYFRDALVRAGNRTPFTLASDYTKIDEARLVASLTRDAVAIAGAGAVRGVKVLSQAPKSLRVP